MSTATRRRSRVDEGWVRCPSCRQLFKHSHSCRASLGEVVSTRPEWFDEQVEQARREARADAAALQQLALTDLPEPCRSCSRVDVPMGDDLVCVPCMAAPARAALGAQGGTGPP